MEIVNRKSVWDNLKKYCYLSDDNDVIEVTKWTNAEGYDIAINKNIGGNILISLSSGEIEAINFLVKYLDTQNK